MRVEFDPEADAAYISLAGDTQVGRTYSCNPQEIDADIHLDFDKEGRLIGIEVLDATHFLPPEVLAEAERA